MYSIDEVRHYWRWTSGYSNPNRSNVSSSTLHAYTPRALRLPSLLSFFFLFTISFTELEILLDKTVKPSEYYKSHGLQAPRKRQAQPQEFPSPEENSHIWDSLRSRQSALCTTHTTTFKPSTTDLNQHAYHCVKLCRSTLLPSTNGRFHQDIIQNNNGIDQDDGTLRTIASLPRIIGAGISIFAISR